MQSGDEYLGEKIEETEETIKIRDFDSNLILTIKKELIESTEDVIYRIVTKSSYEVKGNIVERNSKSMSVMSSQGVLVEIEYSQIEAVYYMERPIGNKKSEGIKIDKIYFDKSQNELDQSQSENTEKSNQTVQQLHSNTNYQTTKNTEFPFVGAAFGLPAGFNILAGYHFNYLTVKFQGMYLRDVAGIQGSILVNVQDSKDNQFNLGMGLCFGGIEKNHEDATYIGLDMNILWSYFTVDLALVKDIDDDGDNYDDDVFIAFSVGFVLRL